MKDVVASEELRYRIIFRVLDHGRKYFVYKCFISISQPPKRGKAAEHVIWFTKNDNIPI